MADVIHRTQRDSSGALLQAYSVNTPDYPTASWVINPDLSALGSVPKYYWKVVGDAVVEMNQSEKDAVDATRLAEAKVNRKVALRLEAQTYFDGRYTAEEQGWFQSLYLEAASDGKPNRQAYIQTWLAWVEGCLSHVRDKIVEVDTKTTVEDVNAVVLNTSAMDSSDPATTLGGVLAITD